ncbi:baseplate J/gp47 family protein [Methylobacter sp.]|uniref:baseplate J/gp47 family protein n=1 Tax=Methylobacter sp. TaxID=2051955 RepID=UPI002FDEBD1B
MAEFISLLASERDGTSQAQRLLAALQADYVAIDEHSLKDHLTLAHAFAKELKYFNADNVEDGDWQGLLNPDGLEGKDFADWLQQIEDFIKQPLTVADDSYYNLHRPHFVLYLTFLQLLQKTHGQLNQLTGRHLDFYYRQVLNFKKKPPQPDRVNVLIEPSNRVNSALLPAGTLLAAGKDSKGKELVYRTDSDLVVNHIRIAHLSSVYVNKQVIDIRKAREEYTGTKNDAVMEMLKIALGDPMPGDALPFYPPSNTKVDFALLIQLQALAKFVGSGLFMDITELRSLIQLKGNRGTAADSDWDTINSILTQAGKNRAGSSFIPASSSPRDFDSNLKTALGVNSLDNYFDTLSLVKNITELYEQRTRQDVKDFIIQKMYLDVETFNQMMRIKVRIDNEWQEINALLEKAGQKKSSSYHMVATEPPDFDKNFTSALGKPAYPNVTGIAKINSLDSFYDALLTIEVYFFMALEDFMLLMDAASDVNTVDALWTKVYDQLALAYRKKSYAAHKAQLNNLRLGQTTADARKLAVQAMMQLALGVPATDNSDLPNRIKELLPTGTDLSLLEQAAGGAELTENDWDSVCNTLELAWRNRVPIPVAQKSNWLSLSAYGDTLTAKVPGSSDADRWYTFGQRQAQSLTDQSRPPEPILGWTVSSPVLCLAQGQRTITLTLVFKPEPFNSEKINAILTNSSPFLIELSTAKGWLSVQNSTVKVADYLSDIPGKPFKSISWECTLDESVAAISALPDTESSAITAPWPMLKLLLQSRWDIDSKNYVTDYPLFQSLLLEKVLLNVDVKGLTDLQLQNDDNRLPAGKPFEPFGSSPAIGTRLYFGHAELMLKRLNKIDINLQWMGVPNANLGDYYKNYLTAIKDNSVFKSKIVLVDQRLELLLNDGAALFNKGNASTPATLTIADIPLQIEKSRSGYRYERQLAADSDKDVTAWQRYWLLELSAYDFQHSAYPGVAAAKSIEMAVAIVNANGATISADTYKVNPPYTPKLKSLSIDYSASIELNPAELQSDSADLIYHLHPFGYAPMQFDPQSGGYSFLPAYNNEGELYLGLDSVEAPQMLSILLQMAEGTANPDLEPASVQWSVLSGNRWLALDKGQLQADATHGLVQSGIIKLQLDSVGVSTLLPSGLYWLRVAIAERCDSVCDTIGIDTQAVTATFVDQDNADDHFNQPLPANTIQSLVEPIATITAVKQPFTSFAAKPGEQDSRFNIRVSERLRHKQRAVSIWDYERMVLEQFPEIYKVKCIPAGLQENLGQVTVVVIPDVRNRLPFNPFEPKAQASLLEDIEAFLAAHAPVGVSVNVKNACFLPVKLRFAVRFQPGCDSSFYKQQLNEDVNHFLSPWAYEQGKDVVIGGKIYANAIIDFIERCTYVDYVAYFKLFLGDESGSSFQLIAKPPLSDSSEGYSVATGRPDAVLVAARTHDIDLITEVNYGEQIFNGINYMKLELDFIVG